LGDDGGESWKRGATLKNVRTYISFRREKGGGKKKRARGLTASASIAKP